MDTTQTIDFVIGPHVASHPPRIPAETWEEIFSKLSSPGDLYNVSITSRYIYNIVNPILYTRLFLDLNHYSTYTLCLLKHDPALACRIKELTLLPSMNRDAPARLRKESEAMYRTLRIPLPSTVPISRLLPLGVAQVPGADVENCIRPIFHFFPSFTGLTNLHIVDDCVPTDFFHWIFELRQLTTLEIRDSIVALELQENDHPTSLRLQTLSILRCWTRPDLAESYIPGKICDGLLKNAPLLTSLTVDLFVERAACLVLSEMDHPPPIQTLSCHGLGPRDPNCTLFCAVLLNLPTITSLSMIRAPRELGPALPKQSLPQLGTLTGQIKTLGFFFEVNRPLQYITITDGPVVPGGCLPWENQLIRFFETLREHGAVLKGLAFNLSAWSEEVFLCVCQLWPSLKELKIQCTAPGVDEVCFPEFQTSEIAHC